MINPASGQPQPIPNVLNDVLHPARADRDVSLTCQSGAAARPDGVDIVAANGGNTTVMEVAQAACILIAQGYAAEDAILLIKEKRAAADPYVRHIQSRIGNLKNCGLRRQYE